MKWFYAEQVQNEYSKKAYLVLAMILFLALFVRIVGIGNIGLHGDEETSAMPALEILRSGFPAFPSGMFYGRAIPHSYLMAISVWIFGQSEWALRLPSCLAGVFAVFFSFLIGKRFLDPKWNLFFALIIALQPWIIAYSKTARMYIFFSAASLFFLDRILHWENAATWRNWFVTLLSFLLALSFHNLAIFLSFCFFIPSLLDYSKKRFLQGLTGFSLSVCAFLMLRRFIESLYGLPSDISIIPKMIGFNPLSYLWTNYTYVFIVLAVIFIIALVIFCRHQKKQSWISIAGLSLIAGSWFGALLLQYHLAFIFFVVGGLLLLRHEYRFRTLMAFGLPLLLIGMCQVLSLSASGHITGIVKMVKALIGKVSVYPYINFLGKFPLGTLAYALVLGIGAHHFIKGKKLPHHYLLFFIVVWLPLFLMGFLVWYFLDRYAFQLVPFYILCCLSGLLYAGSSLKRKLNLHSLWVKSAVAALVLLSFVNPVELYNSIDLSYKNYPDHKGAAQFMARLKLGPNDLVLAEDVLEQVYYGTRVDYWLRGFNDAKQFVRKRNGIPVDIYTNTPVIGTGKEFQELIDNSDGRIYVIGSGETADYQHYYLSNGLQQVYNNYLKKAQILYSGADGKTIIWRLNGCH